MPQRSLDPAASGARVRLTGVRRASVLVALAALNLVLGTIAAYLGAGVVILLGRLALPPQASGGTGAPAASHPATGMALLAEVAAAVFEDLHDTIDWMLRLNPESAVALAVTLLAAIAPAMIAAPALRTTPPGNGSRSLALSVAGAAVVGGACALGILGTVWDIVGMTLAGPSGAPKEWMRGGMVAMVPWVLIPAWIASGTVIAVLIRRAGRAHRPDRVDRFVRWIVAGTCVELAIAAPTYVAAMRRSDCTCSWGSWWAIVAGITSLGVMCGPALVLLATRKARMQWMRGACHHCGYPRHGGAAGPCPECGGLESPAPKAA